MTDSITITSLATVAGIAASVFAVLNVVLRWLMEYISAKFGGTAAASRTAETRQTQSEQCRFDHTNLTSIVTAQNSNISKMLEQNGRMIEAMKDASHVNELRHQIILSKLQRLEDRVT